MTDQRFETRHAVYYRIKTHQSDIHRSYKLRLREFDEERPVVPISTSSPGLSSGQVVPVPDHNREPFNAISAHLLSICL